MIISPTSKFFELSKTIAEEFLESAIIVDDLAGFGPMPEMVPGDRNASPPPSRKRSGGLEDAPEIPERPIDSAGFLDSETRAHLLNAKLVIDGFARKGIVCSVLRPKREEMDDLAGLLSGPADRADILVLDWRLDKDRGDWARAILSSILQSETCRHLARLRLIAIYTGEPNLQEIAGAIKEQMERETGTTFQRNEDLALTWPSGRIVVLAKPQTDVADHYRANVVSFEDLAERLVAEFTTLTAGLVSNVVISALAKVRNNASRILCRFSNLDAPYLSHRFMSDDPMEAEAFLTSLVAGELLGILEEADVGGTANIEAIQSWLAASDFSGIKLPSQDLSTKLVLSVLRDGLKSQSQITPNRQKNLHQQDLTRFFDGSDHGSTLDERFSHITIIRARYDKTCPKLTQGTVIQDPDNASKSYVCVQPRCDSVRLEGPRNFPFLPLEVVQPGTGESFDTILYCDEEGYKRLRGSYKPSNLRLISFRPSASGGGAILALLRDGYYYFEDATISKNSYRWMGDLRSEHALRLSDDFSAVFGRVGLNESEWLRRWAGKRG